jgi:SsrA-binding protein
MAHQRVAVDARHRASIVTPSPVPVAIGDNAGQGRNMSKKNDGKNSGSAGDGKAVNKTIALNRSARHDYHLESRYEAGIALQGWELKSIRAGRMNMGDAYALVKSGEIFLFGAQITPLSQASTHVVADDRRTRKLLMHRHEIDKLVGYVEREGYTLIPTAVYWKGNKVKLELALAKGKQAHDKRQASKDRDWEREKQRTMRRHNKNA